MLPVFTKISAPVRSALLTIDDGPNPETTPLLLDILARHKARATFFVCGKKVERNHELTGRIVREGHGLLSHGYSHLSFDSLSDGQIRDELERTERLLSKYRPTPTPYPLRLPYGEGVRNERVIRAVAAWRADAVLVHWSMTPREWIFVGDCRTPREAMLACRRTVDRIGTSGWMDQIILLHDWPVLIADETPRLSHVRPLLCAVLLEEVILAAHADNVTLAGFPGLAAPPRPD